MSSSRDRVLVPNRWFFETTPCSCYPAARNLHSYGVKTCRRSCRNHAENLRALSNRIREQHQNRTTTQARRIGTTSHRPQIERAAPVVPPPSPRARLALFSPLRSNHSPKRVICMQALSSTATPRNKSATRTQERSRRPRT